MIALELALFRHPWCVVLAPALLALYLPSTGAWLAAALLAAAAFWSWQARHEPRRWWVVALCALSLVLVLLWSGPRDAAPPLEGPVTGGRGTVSAEGSPNASGECRFELRLDSVQSRGGERPSQAVVVVRGVRGVGPAWGQVVAWKGRVVDGVVWVSSWQAVGWSAPWWQARAATRQALLSRFDAWDPASAALARALLLGAVDDLTVAEKRSFRNAGCSHVLALSGMHLSLLALALGALLRRRLDPWVAVALTQAVLAAFCFLAGPIPSLYRAWVMALVVDLGGLGQRRLPPLDLLALSFALTVLLWPPMASTLSLQLSFLSLTGLVLWSRWWEWRLRPLVGRWGATALGPSLAAWMATLPLTAACFGEARWVGILASAPLVLLTNAYLALSVVGLVFVDLVPTWSGAVMHALYQAIFATTAAAGRAPALVGTSLVLVLALAGLGTFVGILYNKGPRGRPMPVSLNYDSPKDLQAFLDDRGFNALKRWGQNFLINPGARRQILDALELAPGEAVWEVGPGLGALTHHLVGANHPVSVFEIDPGYCEFLRREFGASPAGFAVHEGDVIKTWRTALAAAPGAAAKCVGNLPYNAASAIIADFIEGGYFPPVFVVTVQKEMADRMKASVGTKNYSSFSVLCQSVFQLADVVVLKPGSFYPAPEVTSRVVKLVPHGRHPGLDQRRFSTLVRECFSSRRKTLRNNLAGAAAALRLSDDALKSAFLAEGIDLGRRAETLSVDEFLRVYASTDRASTNPS